MDKFPKSADEAKAAWTREAGLAARAGPPLRHAEAFPGKDDAARDISRKNFLALVFCLMVGTAALPHILMRYYTTPSVKQARESVTWSLFFIFLLYFTAPALAVLAKYDVYTLLVGTPFANLPAWAASWSKVKDDARFLRAMAQSALDSPPPLGLFSSFQTSSKDGSPGTLDLKAQGTRPFVDAARVLALASGIGLTGTTERLRACADAKAMPRDEAEALIEAFHFILMVRFRRQLSGMPAGAEPFSRKWMDLAWLAPAILPALAAEAHGLDDWTARFGIVNTLRHNALADAMATAQLFLVLQDQARRAGKEPVRDLLEIARGQQWLGQR